MGGQTKRTTSLLLLLFVPPSAETTRRVILFSWCFFTGNTLVAPQWPAMGDLFRAQCSDGVRECSFRPSYELCNSQENEQKRKKDDGQHTLTYSAVETFGCWLTVSTSCLIKYKLFSFFSSSCPPVPTTPSILLVRMTVCIAFGGFFFFFSLF